MGVFVPGALQYYGGYVWWPGIGDTELVHGVEMKRIELN